MCRNSRARPVAGMLLAWAGLLLISGIHATASMGALPMAEGNPPTLPHPAHMHRGTCATGGELLVLLADAELAADRTGGTPVPEVLAGLATAIPVAQSTTIIPFTLADLLVDPVSIEVHESELEFADVIACGDLGETTTGGEILVGLAPIEPRGVPGIAWLRADGQTTVVTIFLIEGLPMFNAAPAATTDTSAETVEVTLGGPTGEFTISASQTTFRVGVPYNFVVTNSGVIPHEFLIVPAGLGGRESIDMEEVHHVALAQIDEEDLPAGATSTITVTFTELAPAGTLEVVCLLAGHFTAGMHIPIEIVS